MRTVVVRQGTPRANGHSFRSSAFNRVGGGVTVRVSGAIPQWLNGSYGKAQGSPLWRALTGDQTIVIEFVLQRWIIRSKSAVFYEQITSTARSVGHLCVATHFN